jgi:hypothetical protein
MKKLGLGCQFRKNDRRSIGVSIAYNRLGRIKETKIQDILSKGRYRIACKNGYWDQQLRTFQDINFFINT